MQDPGSHPARRVWTSLDVGTEIFVSNKDEVAEWTLSDFDVILSSSAAASNTEPIAARAGALILILILILILQDHRRFFPLRLISHYFNLQSSQEAQGKEVGWGKAHATNVMLLIK